MESAQKYRQMKKNKNPTRFTAPVICAHRGASAYAPENTLAAFKLAIELNADMLELDVQQSRDKKLFIMHDAKVRRTTNGKGRISGLSSAELQKLDAGSWFGEKYADEPIPVLKNVLTLARGKATLNIEVKYDGQQDGMLQQVISSIYDTGFEKDCVLTSFDFPLVDEIKRLAPELAVGYIFSRRGLRAKSFKAAVDILSVHFTLVSKKFLRKSHKAGKKVFVWTVNSKWMMHHMCKLGVDGIITNYPDRLAAVIELYRHNHSLKFRT